MADRELKQYIVRMRDGVNVNVEAEEYGFTHGSLRFYIVLQFAPCEVARFQADVVSAVFVASKQNVVPQ